MKRIIITAACLIALALVATGCGEYDTNKSAENKEVAATQKNQAGLLVTQPVPEVKCSLERQNLINRYHWQAGEALEWPCKSAVGYVTAFSMDGKVLATHVIKGKISSTSSMLTNGTQLVRRCGDLTPGHDERGEDYVCQNGSVDLAEPDGSYGTNGNGKFFFTTDNAYVEYSEAAILIFSSQPMDIPQPVATMAVKNVG